jgi:hypothetical protein
METRSSKRAKAQAGVLLPDNAWHDIMQHVTAMNHKAKMHIVLIELLFMTWMTGWHQYDYPKDDDTELLERLAESNKWLRDRWRARMAAAASVDRL